MIKLVMIINSFENEQLVSKLCINLNLYCYFVNPLIIHSKLAIYCIEHANI